MKKLFPLFTVVVLLLFFPCGCATSTSASNNGDKRIADLEKQVEDLSKQVSTLRERHDKLDEKYSIHVIESSQPEKSVLFLETNSYSTIETKHGHFILSVSKIEPYLDGVKVYLDIGNSSTVTFNGMTIDGFWGDDLFEVANSKQIQKTFTVANTFSPGKMQRIELIIPSVKTSEFKYLGLILNPDEIVYQ